MDNQTIFIISKVNVYYVDIVEYPQRLRIKHLIPSRSKLRHSYLIFMAWTVCFGELKFIKILNYSIVTNTHKGYGYGVERTFNYRSVLLVEEIGVPRKNHNHVTSH